MFNLIIDNINKFMIKGSLIVNAPNGFDLDGAQNYVSKYTSPLIQFGYWAVPIAAAIALLAAYIRWSMKDDQQKEQTPYNETVKKIVIAALVAEAVQIILDLFGL